MMKKDASATGQGGMINQDLIAVVLPNGSLQLEWTAAAETIHRSRELLQREIYKRFVRDSSDFPEHPTLKPSVSGSSSL